MAKLIGGPFGLISGKLGNRVYYIVDGKQMSRKLGTWTTPPTLKQRINRLKMKVAFEFAKTIGVFLEMGFAAEARHLKGRARNLAVGCLRKQALTGEYPDIRIDYPKLVLSRGILPGLYEVSTAVVAGATGTGLLLRYSWSISAVEQDWPRCCDQVMLMACCPEIAAAEERACFKLTGAARSAGEDFLPLPAAFEGKMVEVYIAVISADRSAASDSQYLGRRNVLI